MFYSIHQWRGRESIADYVVLDDGYERAMDILRTRYGRPHVIARKYIRQLVEGPPLKASGAEGLNKMAYTMQQCGITLDQLGYAADLGRLVC